MIPNRLHLVARGHVQVSTHRGTQFETGKDLFELIFALIMIMIMICLKMFKIKPVVVELVRCNGLNDVFSTK